MGRSAPEFHLVSNDQIRKRMLTGSHLQDFRIWLTVYDHLDTVLLYVGPRGIVVMLAVKMVRLLTEQFKKRQNLLNNSRNVQSRK